MAVNSGTPSKWTTTSRWAALLSFFIWAGCASRDDGEVTGTLQESLCSKTTLAVSASGTLLHLTATSPSCATGEVPEYRFLVRRDGASTVNTELRAYGPAPTFDWETSGLPAGKYTLLVYSRAIGSIAGKNSSGGLNVFVGSSCQTSALTATPASPKMPGVNVGLDASAACSAGATPEYRFFLRHGSAGYEEVAGWSGNSHFQWDSTDRPAGPYTVLVYTRAVGNVSTFEGSSSLAYYLGDVCSSVTASAVPPLASAPGSSVQLAASATCLNGGAAQYQFSYLPSGGSTWQVIAPWGASAATWSTGDLAPGNYQISIEARASDYAGKAQSTTKLAYALGGLCSATTFTVTPKSPRPLGTALTLTGAATCTGGSPEYRFLYKNPVSAVYSELSGWGSAPSFTWNTQQQIPGPYSLLVETRALGSGEARQAYRVANYQLGDVCSSVLLAASPASPEPAGTPVSLTATATCVSGGVPEYRFSYRTGKPWLVFRDWGTASASLSGLGLAEGSYEVRVEARGRGHLGGAESDRSVTYVFSPACAAGYVSNGAGACVDVNECQTNNGGCDPLTACSNTAGGFACGACPAGYSGSGATSCQDIDECATNNGGCDARVNCSNTQGSRVCSACPPGFSGSGTSGCSDINECATNNGGCDPLSACSNSEGSFACGPCPAGYSGNGTSGCTDVNECATNNGGCDALTQCLNSVGSFACGPCPAGYSGNGTSGCTDVNECATNNGGCDPLTACINAGGSSSCGPCPPGYTGNGTTGCVLVNPCSPNPCQNGGTCTANGGAPSCACVGGFGGSTCQLPPATLLTAGDVADCTLTTDTATGLLLDTHPGPIALLGDIAYPNGRAVDFTNCFEPAWGRHKARMLPVPGNHEYETSNAAPYYSYFGAVAADPSKGYYSYDLGTWHIVALNSNCGNVSCSAGSTQETWLRQDLAAHPSACTLAYWHHPRFSSGEHGNTSSMSAIWKALVEGGADVALSGHDHDYERFVAQSDSGVATAAGVVQFVVGTGGSTLRAFTSAKPANSVVRDATSNGVLSLTLNAGSYSWNFLPVAGKTFADSGTATCH